MATIIDFQQAGTRSGQRPQRSTQAGTADVVLFPGVRYERYQDMPAAAAAGRRPSRRRQRLELED